MTIPPRNIRAAMIVWLYIKIAMVWNLIIASLFARRIHMYVVSHDRPNTKPTVSERDDEQTELDKDNSCLLFYFFSPSVFLWYRFDVYLFCFLLYSNEIIIFHPKIQSSTRRESKKALFHFCFSRQKKLCFFSWSLPKMKWGTGRDRETRSAARLFT